MTYEQLITFYGSQAAAARVLGISPPSVNEWKEKGIPLPRQAQYELESKGRLKAEKPDGKRNNGQRKAA